MNAEQIVKLIEALGPVLVAIVGGIFLALKVSEAKKATIARLISASYHMATEIAVLTPNKVDDIVATALGELAKSLQASGLELTPAISEQAKLTYTAISGAEKQAVELASKAKAVAVAPVDPSKAPA